MDNLHRLSSAE